MIYFSLRLIGEKGDYLKPHEQSIQVEGNWHRTASEVNETCHLYDSDSNLAAQVRQTQDGTAADTGKMLQVVHVLN
jgi:hypothetical protein